MENYRIPTEKFLNVSKFSIELILFLRVNYLTARKLYS